jgi:hypothetical protein
LDPNAEPGLLKAEIKGTNPRENADSNERINAGHGVISSAASGSQAEAISANRSRPRLVR